MEENIISLDMQYFIFDGEQGEKIILVVLTSFKTEDGNYLVGFELELEEMELAAEYGLPEESFEPEFYMSIDDLDFSVYPYVFKDGIITIRDFHSEMEFEKAQEHYRNNIALTVISMVENSIAAKLN